jgi:hypothetical protein
MEYKFVFILNYSIFQNKIIISNIYIKIHHIREAKMGGCHNTINNNKCSGLPSKGQCVANTIKSDTVEKTGDCVNTIEA